MSSLPGHLSGDDRAPFAPDRFTYEQIIERLERRIRAGEFGGTGKLPSERALCAHYGAGPGAVRHAMRELKSRGLVHFIPFRGTFLALPQACPTCSRGPYNRERKRPDDQAGDDLGRADRRMPATY